MNCVDSDAAKISLTEQQQMQKQPLQQSSEQQRLPIQTTGSGLLNISFLNKFFVMIIQRQNLFLILENF